MIRKSGHRFSEKIVLKQRDRAGRRFEEKSSRSNGSICSIRFGRRHAYDAQARGVEMWRRDARPPSDSKIPMKKPAADFSGGLDDFRDGVVMPVICPTCQTFSKT